MKRIVATMLTVLLVLSCTSVAFAQQLMSNTQSTNSGMKTETYQGDYIVAFNPSYESTNMQGVGSFSNLPTKQKASTGKDDGTREAVAYDFHPQTSNRKELMNQMRSPQKSVTKAVYTVGSTKTFKIIADIDNYPYTLTDVTFECLAVGTYCYVWTPVSGYYPLDGYSTSYAGLAQAHFDSNYAAMIAAFGEPFIPVEGEKVNLMYYDIQDGATTSSSSYVAGYFWGDDISPEVNNSAMINIDTYPAINVNGFSSCYSTMYHEFQHLLNFSATLVGEVDPMDDWLNEAMSMAAEEMIMPGSAVPGRIDTWNNYNNYYEYHLGKSLYNFDNSLGAYAICCLFAQYLRVQTGGYEVFSDILTQVAEGQTTAGAIAAAVAGSDLEGKTLSDINLAFRTALVAFENTGIYGFHGESTFNACNITYLTSGGVSVGGGGAVIIVPTNGTYTVPADAGDLVYMVVDNGSVVPIQSTYTVTFDPNNGSSTWQVTVDRGATVTEPETPESPYGEPFRGWFSTSGLFDFATPIYYDITLTARYNTNYEVWGINDLANIDTDMSGTYMLMNDIDMTGVNWTPIGYNGTTYTEFTGTFLGNGNAITNLTASTSSLNCYGLFAYNSGTIQDLSVDVYSLLGMQHVGSVAGINGTNGQIINCHVTGTDVMSLVPSSVNGYVGGISGQNHGTILRCSTNIVNVSAYYFAGGITGGNFGLIDQCFTTGGVNHASFSSINQGYLLTGYDGGIAGGNAGTISNCYFFGGLYYVCGTSYVGGIAGRNYSGGIVTCCYVEGNNRCYGSSYASLGIGMNQGISTYNYMISTTRGTQNGFIRVTARKFKGYKSITGWDNDIWNFGNSSQYPALRYNNGNVGSVMMNVVSNNNAITPVRPHIKPMRKVK